MHAGIRRIHWGPDDATAEYQVRHHWSNRNKKAWITSRHFGHWRRTVPQNMRQRGIDGVGVLVNTNLAMSIDSFKCLTTQIRWLCLNRCGSLLAVSIFVIYVPTSNYDEKEIKKFYMELKKYYKKDTPSTRSLLVILTPRYNREGHPKNSTLGRMD